MKKLISLVLVLTLMLSFGAISAFATVSVDGVDKDEKTVSVESAQHVKADAAGDDLTVTRDVTGDSQGHACSVIAQNGAEITVGGEVTAELVWPLSAIQASDYSTKVTVEGNVTENGAGNAINAINGAEVTVEGSVTESYNGHAIYAAGSGTTVTVKANVIESDTNTDGNAIYAQNKAIVIVYGDVDENGDGGAIIANNSTVIVGGDVTENDGCSSNPAVMAENGAQVIVEGTVTASGFIGASDGSALYLGQLDGEIGYDRPYVHYLIGIAPEGSVALSEVTIVSAIVADDTIDGINEKGYRYTTTADKDALNGKTIILKPADGKELTVKGFDGADVTCVKNADGTVTFTLGSDFKGGLQNLVLVLVDKSSPKANPAPTYYIVPVCSVTVVELVLPDGVEEGMIKELDSADKAGITVDSSIGSSDSVRVFLDGEELDAKDFTVQTNQDGSFDIILSNAYLRSLGSGSYDFTVVIGDMEIELTVEVTM